MLSALKTQVKVVMANQPHQKLKTLRILQTPFEQTDSTHGLTTQEIIGNLLSLQGIPAERKAIYRDIRNT